MNIKVKAALDVVYFVVGCMLIGGVARLGLDYFEALYGSEQVFNGIIFAGMTVLLISMTKLMYDVRLNQLKYRNKLNEMVKK